MNVNLHDYFEPWLRIRIEQVFEKLNRKFWSFYYYGNFNTIDIAARQLGNMSDEDYWLMCLKIQRRAQQILISAKTIPDRISARALLEKVTEKLNIICADV